MQLPGYGVSSASRSASRARSRSRRSPLRSSWSRNRSRWTTARAAACSARISRSVGHPRSCDVRGGGFRIRISTPLVPPRASWGEYRRPEAGCGLRASHRAGARGEGFPPRGRRGGPTSLGATRAGQVRDSRGSTGRSALGEGAYQLAPRQPAASASLQNAGAALESGKHVAQARGPAC